MWDLEIQRQLRVAAAVVVGVGIRGQCPPTMALLCLHNKVPGTVCFGGADTSYQNQEGNLEELLTSWPLIGLTTKIKNPATETENPAIERASYSR